MWLELTDLNDQQLALNFANVVQMQQFDGYTSLWTNVAKGDSWLVFRVKDPMDDILRRLQ